MVIWTRNLDWDIDALHRQVEQAFGDFGLSQWPWPFSRTSFLPARAARVYPLVNLSEDSDAYYVEALAPGVDPDTLDVAMTQNRLTVSGEKKGLPENGIQPDAFHRRERGTARFVRTIDMPGAVDEKKIKADYKNGLLLVTLPKAEEAKPKQISVKVR